MDRYEQTLNMIIHRKKERERQRQREKERDRERDHKNMDRYEQALFICRSLPPDTT